MAPLIAGMVLITSPSHGAVAFQADETSRQESDLDQLFRAAVQAAGDEQAIADIRSIESFAQCDGPTGEYTTEVYSFRNNKTRFRQVFPERSATATIFINEETGWQVGDPAGSPSLIPSFQKLVVRLHEYQRMAIDFQTMFTDFEFVGETTFDGKPASRVNAKAGPETPIQLFFDPESKRMSGYILPTPDGPVTNIFDEWTQVDHVRLPSVVRAIDSSGEFVLRFEKITLNESDESALDIPPRIADLESLTQLQKQAETAHLTYDARLLVDMFAEEGITEINRGEVNAVSKEAALSRFQNYFESVRFLEWADIARPVFQLSDDGTLATVIVQKRVRLVPRKDLDESNEQQFEFAWMELWRNVDGNWKLKSMASTDRPVRTPEDTDD